MGSTRPGTKRLHGRFPTLKYGADYCPVDMPEITARRNPGIAPPADTAIAQIVEMSPRRVTVTLSLPIPNSTSRPTVTLEWSREDTTMPLSELLERIEQYINRFGGQ